MKTIKLTTHWSAADANATIEFLDDLKDAIWEAYGSEITDMFKAIEDEQIHKAARPADEDIDF